MSIFDNAGNGNDETKPYIPAPAGMHPARLVSVVDLGSHDSTWEGVTRTNRMFHLAWELVGTDSGDGKPFIVSKSYKASAGQWGPYFAKTSGAFKMLKAWLGWDDKKASKVKSLPTALGQGAIVQVIHKASQDGSKTWANIANVMPPMPQMPVGEAVTEPLLWSIDGGDLDKLPAFLAKKARESYELQGKAIPTREVRDAANTDTSDVPF